MFTSYKAGVLRPELIRLRDLYVSSRAKAIEKIKHKVMEVKPTKKHWWSGATYELPDMRGLSETAELLHDIGKAVEARLDAMIDMCDHAFNESHVLYLDHDDLLLVKQLRDLENMK